MSSSKSGRMQAWQRGRRQHLLEVEQKCENLIQATCIDQESRSRQAIFCMGAGVEVGIDGEDWP